MNTGTWEYAGICMFNHPELVEWERLHDKVCDLKLRLAALQIWLSLPSCLAV